MQSNDWSAPRHRVPCAITAAIVSTLLLSSVVSLFSADVVSLFANGATAQAAIAALRHG